MVVSILKISIKFTNFEKIIQILIFYFFYYAYILLMKNDILKIIIEIS